MKCTVNFYWLKCLAASKCAAAAMAAAAAKKKIMNKIVCIASWTKQKEKNANSLQWNEPYNSDNSDTLYDAYVCGCGKFSLRNMSVAREKKLNVLKYQKI